MLTLFGIHDDVRLYNQLMNLVLGGCEADLWMSKYDIGNWPAPTKERSGRTAAVNAGDAQICRGCIEHQMFEDIDI